MTRAEPAGRLTDSQREAVAENMGLVFSFVVGQERFRRDKDDLIQEGAKGLMEAVRTHGEQSEIPFGPYAKLRIKRFIHKYLAENRPIRVSLSSFKGRTVAWKVVAASLRTQSFEATREDQGSGEGIEPADVRPNAIEVREKCEAIEAAIGVLPDHMKTQIRGIYLDEIGLRAYARETGRDYRHMIRRRDHAFESMRRHLEAQGWTIED